MMGGVSRYVAVASLSCGLASASGLGAAQTPAPLSVAPKVPAVAKLAPAPEALTGTLFNSREERERLDRTRLRGGAIEDEVAATVEPERPVINGFVKRSDGRNTVWVDDMMKCDSRAEVVERLEPNMVGGGAVGAILRMPSNAKKVLVVVVPRAIKGKSVATSKNKVLRKNRSPISITRMDSITSGAWR
jgi:hypothetical protein